MRHRHHCLEYFPSPHIASSCPHEAVESNLMYSYIKWITINIDAIMTCTIIA